VPRKAGNTEHKAARIQLAALLAFGVLATSSGGYLAYGELTAAVAVVGRSEGELFGQLSERLVPLPPSERSQLELLRNCFRTYHAVYSRAQPTSVRRILAASCSLYAEEVSRRSPALGLAWATLAAFRAELGDAPGFSNGLKASRGVSPNEGWLAQFRAELVSRYADIADKQAYAVEEADLQVLARGVRSIGWIAATYAYDHAFRKRVLSAVSKLPANQQSKFIELLRSSLERE
jgi:hypothetical protein